MPMSRSVQETSVAEIAKELVRRRDRGQRTILFLGSRTGGLFGNQYLYETLKQFSLLNFDTLSSTDKFRECYYALRKHFTAIERHNILVGALATRRYREEDWLLARLLTTGLFEAVISTNIDTFLENACDSLKLEVPDDYIIITSVENGLTRSKQNTPRYSSIIKAFGDLESRSYPTPGGSFDLRKGGLQEFLQSKLSKNILIIGYDHTWDQAVEQAFPLSGGTIWYVNETVLSEKSFLAQILSKRESQYLGGNIGSYSNFIVELCKQDVVYKMIGKTEDLLRIPNAEYNMNNKLTNSSSPNISGKKLTEANRRNSLHAEKENISKDVRMNSQGVNRRTIFISYSHKDKKFMKELSSHLISFNNPNNSTKKMNLDTDFWSDEKIEVGKDWQEKILQSLEAAEVAILLISQHFLSSKFITEIELPRLLSASRNKGLVIIPVILRNCMIHETPLHLFQAINGEKPLEEMKPSQRDVIWVRVIKQAIIEKTSESK